MPAPRTAEAMDVPAAFSVKAPSLGAAAIAQPQPPAGYPSLRASLPPQHSEPTAGGVTAKATGLAAASAAVACAIANRSNRRSRRAAAELSKSTKNVASRLVMRVGPEGKSMQQFKEMDAVPVSTSERALAVNLDNKFYGSFAEIGAGQEVSRFFFRAGAAAGTVARSVSAYDMQMSDRMYGTSNRYVSKDRLLQMCRQEYDEIETTLRDIKGPDCRFFSFAATIAAKAYMSDRECEGWMGILYQHEVGASPSTIWIHVRMKDPTAELQGDALGILGLNMVYLAKDKRSPKQFVKHLLDDIKPGRLTINAVGFEGPAWPDVNPKLVALYLVQWGLAEAVIFQPDGNGNHTMGYPNDAFYKRPLCFQRGRFRMLSKTNEAIFEASQAKLAAELDSPKPPLPVVELVINPLGYSEEALMTDMPIEVERDYLSRFTVLSCLDIPILVSGIGPMYSLAEYARRYTTQKVVIAVGGGQYNIVRGIFREADYIGLKGGMLEAFGKLFAQGARLLVFPNVSSDDGAVSPGLDSAEGGLLDAERITLLEHLKITDKIVPIEFKYINPDVLNPETNSCFREKTQDVLDLICRLDSRWKDFVPTRVVDIVEKRGIAQVLGTLTYNISNKEEEAPLEQFYKEFMAKQGK